MISKKFLWGMLVTLVLSLGAGAAAAGDRVEPADLIGPYCFSFDNYIDTWHWRVDRMPRDLYQVTGYDYAFGGSAMVGGGYRNGATMTLEVIITDSGNGWRAIHAITLDLTTYTGTSDFTWYDEMGNPTGFSYVDEPFSLVNCGAPVDKAGLPSTRPIPEGTKPVEPADVGIQSLTGWQCFTLDSFSDTYELFFVDMGGGAHQVTGYDTIYYGSAMHGGGMQIGDHMYLALTESLQESGDRCIHAMDIDLTTMTGTTTFIWKYFDETVKFTYFQLPLSQCGVKAAGDAPASNPAAVMPRVPELPQDKSLDIEAILGRYCFTLDNWADTWYWQIDQVAPGIFEVTGLDTFRPGTAINGGGWRTGNKVYLNMLYAIPATGQRCFSAIDFDLVSKTGTADFTWIYQDGSSPIPYQNEPFSMIACGTKATGLPFSDLRARLSGEHDQVVAAEDLTVAAAPNPFNPKTTISFNLPRTGHVQVDLYDVSGRLVKTLVSETRQAGENKVEWDGASATGGRAASGVYFAVVQSDDLRATSRLVLLK